MGNHVSCNKRGAGYPSAHLSWAGVAGEGSRAAGRLTFERDEMLKTYVRPLFVGVTVCVLGGAFAGLACTDSPKKSTPRVTGSARNNGGGNTTGSSTGNA